MENEKKVKVEMTAEQAEAFAAFQAKQKKEAEAAQRKADRETYAKMVDEEVAAAIPELRRLRRRHQGGKIQGVPELCAGARHQEQRAGHNQGHTAHTHLYPFGRQHAPDIGLQLHRRLPRHGGGRHRYGEAVYRKPRHRREDKEPRVRHHAPAEP